MRKHRANWLFQDSQESGGDELHAIQWRVAVTEGCKCHSGDVLMKALHAQHERQLFCSLWHQLLLAGELPTGLEGVQWKVHREPDGEGTELAVWTSHRQTDGALVHLCYPSPGGHEEEVAWWEEETQLADGKRSGLLPACVEASISNNATASGAAFFPGLEMPARWGTRNHPKTKHGQEVSQEKREQRQIGLQTGCMAFASYADPASSSQVHAGEMCPAGWHFEMPVWNQPY